MTIVHTLHRGVALCGFGEGKVPAAWPPGHKWLGLNVLAATFPEDHRMCEDCAAIARRDYPYED